VHEAIQFDQSKLVAEAGLELTLAEIQDGELGMTVHDNRAGSESWGSVEGYRSSNKGRGVVAAHHGQKECQAQTACEVVRSSFEKEWVRAL